MSRRPRLGHGRWIVAERAQEAAPQGLLTVVVSSVGEQGGEGIVIQMPDFRRRVRAHDGVEPPLSGSSPLGSRFGQCREHLDVRYLAFAPVGAQPESSDESEAVAWFPIEGLPDNMGADLPRPITVARAVVNRG